MTGLKMTDTPTKQHTPGPWRWELNENSKGLSLVGGKPMYDLTIIRPTRWGMGSATLLIRDTAHNGMNILHKLHDRRDWIAPFNGREHHAHWCAGVCHPDMLLIQAAPDMLQALRRSSLVLAAVCERHTEIGADEVYKEVSRVIEEAVFGKKEE